MKKNFQNFLCNAEALMLLADILHNVLFLRARRNICKPENTTVCKWFDDMFKRLCNSVDCRAVVADRELRCKIRSKGSDGVYINILPSSFQKYKNKKRVIKKY